MNFSEFYDYTCSNNKLPRRTRNKSSGWTCVTCTLKNEDDSAKCSACDHERPAPPVRRKRRIK